MKIVILTAIELSRNILHRRVIVMCQGHCGGSKVYPQSLLRTNEKTKLKR